MKRILIIFAMLTALIISTGCVSTHPQAEQKPIFELIAAKGQQITGLEAVRYYGPPPAPAQHPALQALGMILPIGLQAWTIHDTNKYNSQNILGLSGTITGIAGVIGKTGNTTTNTTTNTKTSTNGSNNTDSGHNTPVSITGSTFDLSTGARSSVSGSYNPADSHNIDNTSTPTVVTQPAPVIVTQPQPLVVTPTVVNPIIVK